MCHLGTLVGAPTVEGILRKACAEFKVTMAELFSKSKTDHLAWARSNVMERLWSSRLMSQSDIGRMFHRHHSTVNYAIYRVQGARADRQRYCDGRPVDERAA